jgi:hypothetical protein
VDAFVTKLSPAGNTLVYSTYLGGNGGETGWGIAVDGSGQAVVTGDTTSYTTFPTKNAVQPAVRARRVLLGCLRHPAHGRRQGPRLLDVSGRQRRGVHRPRHGRRPRPVEQRLHHGHDRLVELPTLKAYQFVYGGQIEPS